MPGPDPAEALGAAGAPVASDAAGAPGATAARRIDRHGTLRRGAEVLVEVDGIPTQAFEGETVATVLAIRDLRVLRRAPASGAARGYYCGIGLCYECLVEVDEVSVRACLSPVRAGARIVTTARGGA